MCISCVLHLNLYQRIHLLSVLFSLNKVLDEWNEISIVNVMFHN